MIGTLFMFQLWSIRLPILLFLQCDSHDFFHTFFSWDAAINNKADLFLLWLNFHKYEKADKKSKGI